MTFKHMLLAGIASIICVGDINFYRLGDRIFKSEEDVEDYMFRQMYPEEFEE